MGKHFFTFEKREEEKRNHHLNDYFKNVIEKIKDSDSIIIFGPAETKNGLQKAILKKKELSSRLVKVEAEDHLTDNQVKAKVRSFFNNNK
jgi:stalled ribosome rescue protein Dom34